MPRSNRIAQVDAYIKKSPEFSRPIMTKLRELFHQASPHLQETMKWGVPHFEYKGIVGAFAAFKQHVGLGFWKSKLLKDPVKLFGDDPKASMCSAKFSSLDQLPSDKVILSYIKQAVELNEKEIQVPAKKSQRPKLRAPDYFTAALAKNRKARETYDSFTESQRRDYIEWLLDAKQEATRTKRLATALKWLSEGKQRNWKYMKSKK